MTDEQKNGGTVPEQENLSEDGSSKKAEKDGDTGAGMSVMPKPTFSTFILSLASSTLVHLGEVLNPATNEHSEDVILAKHSIDTLTMLQEKTRGGLDQDEVRLLEGLLYELRMKYVVKK